MRNEGRGSGWGRVDEAAQASLAQSFDRRHPYLGALPRWRGARWTRQARLRVWQLPGCGETAAGIFPLRAVPSPRRLSPSLIAGAHITDTSPSSPSPHSSWPTIPQLYLGGEFVGGCDIALQLHQSGELEKLLVEQGVIEADPSDKEQAGDAQAKQ